MCWLPLLLGTLMLLTGALLVARFFVGRGADSPEAAGTARNESMIVGTALVAIGLLLFFLELTGAICGLLGIS
jgi:uncharacterized membrane protein HdeD (DUF308 family)